MVKQPASSVCHDLERLESKNKEDREQILAHQWQVVEENRKANERRRSVDKFPKFNSTGVLDNYLFRFEGTMKEAKKRQAQRNSRWL